MPQHLNYRILLTRKPEGGFTVNVPALPGCITFGENMEEAVAMAKDAIELYIESLLPMAKAYPPKKIHLNILFL